MVQLLISPCFSNYTASAAACSTIQAVQTRGAAGRNNDYEATKKKKKKKVTKSIEHALDYDSTQYDDKMPCHGTGHTVVWL